MRRRNIIWGLVGLGALAILIGFYVYNQRAATEVSGPADYEMTPAALIAEFEKNPTASNDKYIGRSILFSGKVVEIAGDSVILVKLDAGAEGYTVNCGFDKHLSEKLTGVVAGDEIKAQCSCSGITKPDDEMSLLSEKSLDMTRCSLIKWTPAKPGIGTDIEHAPTDTSNQ